MNNYIKRKAISKHQPHSWKWSYPYIDSRIKQARNTKLGMHTVSGLSHPLPVMYTFCDSSSEYTWCPIIEYIMQVSMGDHKCWNTGMWNRDNTQEIRNKKWEVYSTNV